MITRRSVSITTAADGSGSGTLTLGHAYARVVRIRVTEATTATTDITVVDEDSKTIFAKTGVDDSPAYDKYLVADEADVVDVNGEAAAANAEGTPPPVANSPLTITLANGGDTKTHTFYFFVEGSYH